MCRAGKDKTRRYCPATTNKERKKERNARRRLAHMKKVVQNKLAEAVKNGATPEELEKIGYTAKQAAYRKHVEYVHTVIDKLRSEGKETHLLHASITSSGHLLWDQDRKIVHAEIIREQLKKWEDVPCEGKALFSGGLGGAGKSTVLRKHANIDTSQYATLNPDDIKEILAEKGLIPQIDGLTPMEASPLVHEEASHITSELANILMKRKKNIIYDITMASYSSTKKKIDRLRDSGYDPIDGIFVDISPEMSEVRADFRHLEGHNDFLKGKGYGGRVLPKGLSKSQVPDDAAYRSKNAEIFTRLQAEGVLSDTSAYCNNVNGRAPLKLAHLRTNEELVAA